MNDPNQEFMDLLFELATNDVSTNEWAINRIKTFFAKYEIQIMNVSPVRESNEPKSILPIPSS